MEIFAVFTALEAAGSIAQGAAVQSAANDQAKSVEQAALFNEQLRKQKSRKAIGTQIAQAASGGFNASNFEVIADSAVQSDLQGQIDLFNAKNQANTIRQQGRIAFGEGIIGAVGSAAEFGTVYAYNKFNDIRVKPKPEPKSSLPTSYGSNVASGGLFI